MVPFRLFDVAMRALIAHRLWYGLKLPIGWAVPAKLRLGNRIRTAPAGSGFAFEET
jgi:hypothetical protein